MSGPVAVTQTYARMKDCYFFPLSLGSVARYISSRITYHQHMERTPQKKQADIYSRFRVSGPFLRILLDYCGLLTVTKRKNKYVLLAICPLTKYITAKPVSHGSTTNATHFLE